MSRKNRKILDEVRDVLRRKHYPIHTERIYVLWIKKFIHFHQMTSRDDLVGGKAGIYERNHSTLRKRRQEPRHHFSRIHYPDASAPHGRRETAPRNGSLRRIRRGVSAPRFGRPSALLAALSAALARASSDSRCPGFAALPKADPEWAGRKNSRQSGRRAPCSQIA